MQFVSSVWWFFSGFFFFFLSTILCVSLHHSFFWVCCWPCVCVRALVHSRREKNEIIAFSGITWHFYGKKIHIAHAYTQTHRQNTWHVNTESILITKKQTIDKKFDLLSSQKKNISIFSRILSYIDRTVYVNLNELMHRQHITSVHLSKLKSAVRHSHVRAQQAFQCLIRHHNGGFSYFPKLIS